MGEKFLAFTLTGSFIVPGDGGSSVPALNEPQPDNSAVAQFVKENFADGLTVRSLFADIEADHKEVRNLYLVPRDVVVIPRVAPKTAFERVAVARKLLAQCLTYDQIQTVALGHSQLVVKSLEPWTKYVVSVVLGHLHSLVKSGYYQEEKEREALMEAVFSMFGQRESQMVRLAAPVQLKEGSLAVRGNDGLCLIVQAPDKMMVMSGDMMSWPGVTFDEKSSVALNVITVKDNDSEKYVKLEYDDSKLPRMEVMNAIWPPATREWPSVRAVVDSCRGLYGAKEISGGQAAGIAKVVSSLDCSFVLALYNSFTNVAAFEPIGNALMTLFASENRELQLLKLVSFQELRQTSNVNELFRKNNNYFRTITQLLGRISDNYKNTTVRKLCELVVKSESWSYDNPKAEDIARVENLLTKFFQMMIDEVDNVPVTIRSLCRFLRLLSERMYRTGKLNHRTVFALFILRYMCPALTDPKFAVETGAINPKELTKVVQFTRLLAYVGQLQYIDQEHHAKRADLNATVDKLTPMVLEFFDRLCVEQTREGELSVSKAETIEAAQALVAYVEANEQQILSYNIPICGQHMFVDELLCEYITQAKDLK